MKRMVIPLPALLILSLFFAACGPGDDSGILPEAALPEEQADAENPAESTALTPEEREALALAKFDAAEAAYAWFRGRNQPELGGDSIELFGNKYYPVLDPRFSDMETLRAYLNTLFQAEITEALLNREAGGGLPVFTASGGKLYMLGGDAAGGSRALTMRPTALSPASPPSTRTMPPSAASAQA